MAALFGPKWPETMQARCDGQTIAVAVRVHPRAKHYRLAVGRGGEPVLTVPRSGRLAEAQAFVARQSAWLLARLERAVKPVSFSEGAVVPLRGVDHRIEGTGKLRGRVEVLEGIDMPALLVPGEDLLARRLTDWLKAEAKSDLEARVIHHTACLGATYKSVQVRAQSSRWGSCASSGRLNFNWRLVLAPPFVLDYVAAHEVAHLIEMNHSQAFWDTVERTLPDMARGRAWLKAHGRELMAYGAG
jgi:hypothetical protein